ncbi:MAG: hypothetical protein WDA08_02010 [Weeksellaceae bacterium]
MTTAEKVLIQSIEEKTGLKFRESESDGNLCFRNNNMDLRDDFKEVFYASDLRFYMLSFSGHEISLPENNLDFWEKVKIGKKFG